MYSLEIKNKAKDLRKQGYSYEYISKQVGVVKSTLSLWLRGVTFFPNENFKNVVSNAQKKTADFKRVDKMNSLKTAQIYAQERVAKLSKNDLFMIGLGIYIGEGSKSHDIVRVVNSDPRIIRFTLRWFKECFDLSDNNFRIRLHIYPDTDPKKALIYWSNELMVNVNLFQPYFVDERKNKRKNRAGVLPFGTAHLGIASNGNKEFGVLLHRKILATIDRVLNAGLV